MTTTRSEKYFTSAKEDFNAFTDALSEWLPHGSYKQQAIQITGAATCLAGGVYLGNKKWGKSSNITGGTDDGSGENTPNNNTSDPNSSNPPSNTNTEIKNEESSQDEYNNNNVFASRDNDEISTNRTDKPLQPTEKSQEISEKKEVEETFTPEQDNKPFDDSTTQDTIKKSSNYDKLINVASTTAFYGAVFAASATLNQLLQNTLEHGAVGGVKKTAKDVKDMAYGVAHLGVAGVKIGAGIGMKVLETVHILGDVPEAPEKGVEIAGVDDAVVVHHPVA